MAESIVTDPTLLTVLATSAAARDSAIELLEDVSARTSTTGPTPQDYIDISKKQKRLYYHLAQLRGQNRDAVQGARETKAETTTARQEVDRLHLQLQNLYYEQRHLQGEIAACEGYDHSYTHLPLIPITDFLVATNQDQDSPLLLPENENDLTVARIAHEHSEREKLEQERQGLLKKKQALIADNKKRKDDLAGLDKMLENFLSSADPILKVLEKNG